MWGLCRVSVLHNMSSGCQVPASTEGFFRARLPPAVLVSVVQRSPGSGRGGGDIGGNINGGVVATVARVVVVMAVTSRVVVAMAVVAVMAVGVELASGVSRVGRRSLVGGRWSGRPEPRHVGDY
jgi:hypothetical protein